MLTIAGVPEHFNYPFHLLENQKPSDYKFLSCPGGSGEMHSLLLNSLHETQNKSSENIVDIATLLGEAALSFVDQHPEFVIWGEFVISPITWGVYCSSNSEIEDWKQTSQSQFGISREGSGSQLMALYEASKTFGLENINFKVVGHLQGAREQMKSGEIDVFMWEELTTDFLVDSGEWKKIHHVSGDWPSFVFVGRRELFEDRDITFRSFYQQVELAKNEMISQRDLFIPQIAQKFNLDPEKLKKALNRITWSSDGSVDIERYQNLQKILKKIGKMKNDLTHKQFSEESLCLT